MGRGIFDGFGVFSLSVLGVSTLMVSLNSLEFMVSQGRALALIVAGDCTISVEEALTVVVVMSEGL